MPYGELIRTVLPFLCVGAILVFLIAVAMWEKRPIQPYYIPAEGDEYEPSPIAVQANRDAKRLGYTHGVLCHDGKGKLYRVRYDFWISPDRNTIAVIGSGTVAGMPAEGIWFYSRSTDGRSLCTTNNVGEQDISGIEDQFTWPNYLFRPLVEKHKQKLGNVNLAPFDGESPMAGFFEIRRSKASALVARGNARYIDDEQTAWRYSLKGAVTFYVTAICVRPFKRLLRTIGVARQ